MKLSMVKASWVILACILIFSCGQTKQQQDKTQQVESTDTTAKDKVAFADAFRGLTGDPEKHAFGSLQREINNINDINELSKAFNDTMSKKLGITIDPNSDPRLCLAVNFDGPALDVWMKRMYNDEKANTMRIVFFFFLQNFLNGYLSGSGHAAERKNRLNRITAILAAYQVTINKATADTTEDFKGGYNLGGMQP
ncbi:MAG: hypothetical protein DI538_19660 [Azospira oryzae]|nr:MAG: hypothetical protein DI538_19660 [Azospira oryzae]